MYRRFKGKRKKDTVIRDMSLPARFRDRWGYFKLIP